MNRIVRYAVFVLLLLNVPPRAQAAAPFPEDCWGVYSWASWNPKNVSRKSHPLIKGAPMILKWRDVEPQPGRFTFNEAIGETLKLAEENGFYTFLMIWVAPKAPEWLYENGVPEVKMTPTIGPLGQPRGWTFQYYLDEDYIRYYHRMLTRFCEFVKDLPRAQRDRILYIQSAEGSTGDGGGYKGDPLDSRYNISREQWGTFRIEAWEVMKAALSDKQGNMVVPLLVNYDANRQDQYNWVVKNLDVVGLKNGMFSHGYHISGTQTRLRNWRQFTREVEAAGKVFFSRGEQDAEYKTYGWSTQNIGQGLYWSAIFATHCGLDMWNVPWQACAGYTYQEAIEFFNKYASHHDASTSPAAFCALRKGLDASDTKAYPESQFGEANKKNIDRYLAIAKAYCKQGAIQGDPPKAIGGGMVNRKRQHYNDVGWGIEDGNYARFLTQIDPGLGDIGWWHADVSQQNCRYADASIYSRFARGFSSAQGKNALYFDLHDDLFQAADLTAGITFTVIYYDGVRDSTWELRYDNGARSMATALAVTNTGSGAWRTLKATVADAAFTNGGPRGADITLINTDPLDDIFHLIEVELTVSPPGGP